MEKEKIVSENSDKKIELKNSIANIKENGRKAHMVLRALNHKLRQSIISRLDEKDQLREDQLWENQLWKFKKNDLLRVTDLYILLRQKQPVMSQHLAILRKQNIIKDLKDWKEIYYFINDKRIWEIKNAIEKCLYSERKDNKNDKE